MYSLIFAVLLVSATAIVLSAPQSPQFVANPGHALECISGREKQGANPTIYNPSTTGVNYQYDDVFTGDAPASGAPETSCNDGWVMTGCSASTDGAGQDNDESMNLAGGNGCRGDNTGASNTIYARCCRVVGN